MNQQFRYGENDIFFKTLTTLARFSPRRVICAIVHRIEAIDTDRNSYLWYLCLPMLPQKNEVINIFHLQSFS